MKLQIIEILSKIIDNRFYQGLVSIFLTFIIRLFLDEDWIIFKKFGDFWGSIFIFVSCLLFIEVIIILFTKIKYFLSSRKYNQYLYEKNKKETLNKIWTTVDEMTEEEKRILMYFLENDNKPFLDTDKNYSYNHLLISGWVHKSEYHGNKKKVEEVKVYEKGKYIKKTFTTNYKYQYILEENIYNILKISLDKYDKISHFK